MLTREILAVILGALIGTGFGISIFAGSSKEKLTVKMVVLMVFVGMTTGLLTWTYLKDDEVTKIIIRSVLFYTLFATVFTKLIFRIIQALTNIPEKQIQKIGVDFVRKKLHLDEAENFSNTIPDSDLPVDPDLDDESDGG